MLGLEYSIRIFAGRFAPVFAYPSASRTRFTTEVISESSSKKKLRKGPTAAACLTPCGRESFSRSFSAQAAGERFHCFDRAKQGKAKSPKPARFGSSSSANACYSAREAASESARAIKVRRFSFISALAGLRTGCRLRRRKPQRFPSSLQIFLTALRLPARSLLSSQFLVIRPFRQQK